MKVLKVSHENQRHVRNSQDSSCSKRWAAEWWSKGDEGKRQKEMKKNGARRNFLPFVWEQREGLRGKLRTHSKPKDQSWTGATAQQTLGRLENRPSPTSFTLLPNTITTTFCSFFGGKDTVSAVFPLERHQAAGKAAGHPAGLGFQPSRTADVPPGEPVQATRASWQRCGEPRSVMLMSGHPSWVLEQQRFRHLYHFKLASD